MFVQTGGHLQRVDVVRLCPRALRSPRGVPSLVEGRRIAATANQHVETTERKYAFEVDRLRTNSPAREGRSALDHVKVRG